MTAGRRALILGVVAATAATAAATLSTPASANGGGPAASLGAPGSDVTIVRTPSTGLVRFIGTRAGHPLARPAGVDGRTPPAEAARAFLSAHAGLFGITDPGRQLATRRSLISTDGGHVVRFQEMVGGYPVLGGQLSVTLTSGNEINYVDGETIPVKQLLPVPTVSRATARTVARQVTAKELRVAGRGRGLRVDRPVLTVFDPALAGIPTTVHGGLVYRVEVRGTLPDAAPVDELVLVDAVTGAVALHVNQVEYAAEQTVCTAADDPNVTDFSCPPSGSPGTTVIADPGTSSDTDTKDAYYYAQATYDFYQQVVGKAGTIGIPGSASGDRALISTVHACDQPSSQNNGVCNPLINAYWDGTSQMVYGDGFASADDVVGHELTHSVTQHTSNLFYWYQSGAINESLSDTMGELADQWNAGDPVLAGADAPGSGTDTDTVRWQMAEDLSLGTLRDMSDPTLQNVSYSPSTYATPQPDKMTSKYYDASQDPNVQQAIPSDNGGVHTNSGVGNKAAYLIVDGSANDPSGTGTFNGVTVAGFGGATPGASRLSAITKAAKIYYLVDQSLTSAADYADLYYVLPAACDALVGTAGITSGDCATVRAAVKATEMNKQPRHGTAPEAPGCGSSPTSTDWYDNLEKPSSGRWTRSPNAGRKGPFYYPQYRNIYGLSQVYATSGDQEIWGDDPDPYAAKQQGVSIPRDGAIAMTGSVRVPVGKTMYLRFNHAYQFEWYPATTNRSALYVDGGRIEYSVGGSPWKSAGSLFDANGYNHTLHGFNSAGTTVIYTFKGFGGDSHGYISSRLKLSSLAGRSLRIRFRDTADATTGAYGWFIDDVRFYTCGPRPSAPYPVGAKAGTRQVSVSWKTPADHGTSRIRSYRVTIKAGRTVLRRTTVGAATHAITVRRLPSGRTVTAYVTAANAAGAGPAGRSRAVVVG